MKILINVKSIKSIFKKELRNFFINPSFYIVYLIFSSIWLFLFFRNAFLIGDASLRSLFEIFPWLSLILIPALTMGSFSKEYDDGTLELLVTRPLREIEIIIGKLVANILFVLFSLLPSLAVAIAFSQSSSFDWGAFVAQFIGVFLFGLAFVSLGLYISSLFSNQIASLILTIVCGFILLLLGSDYISAVLPLYLTRFLEGLSFISHLSPFLRGVLLYRDVLYFVSFVVLFIGLTLLHHLKRKFGRFKLKHFSQNIIVLLSVALFIALNFLGTFLPGRVDLTKNKSFTLSTSTRNLISQLNDPITMQFFVSENLPVQYSSLASEVKDLLRDYEFYGKGRLTVTVKDPSAKPEYAQEAADLGIREVQFNVIGQEEYQVKTGYLGLSIKYGDKTELLPFITDTNDLEYKVTSLISKISSDEKKTLAFLTGHEEKSPFSDYSALNEELEKQYDVILVSPNEVSQELDLDDTVSVLVIAGPLLKLEEKTVASIKSFISSGHSVLFLADEFSIDTSIGIGQPVDNGLDTLLTDLGVIVNKDVVYDLKFNETIRFGDGTVNYLLPYPFWIKALPNKNAPIMNLSLENEISLPWPASLVVNVDTLKTNGYESVTLLSTSSNGGLKLDPITISPDPSNFPQANLAERVVALALSPNKESDYGKVLMVGDSDFLSDDFISNNQDNLTFMLNSFSWLSGVQTFADIKAKAVPTSKLQLESNTDIIYIKILSYGASASVVLGVGLVVYMRRRYLGKLKYNVGNL